MRLTPAVAGFTLVSSLIGVPPASATIVACSTSTPSITDVVTCSPGVTGLAITIPSGATTMTATLLGGGGGGGGRYADGTGGAGANGARVQASLNVVGISTIQVTVGTGGIGGSSGYPPGNGGAGMTSKIVGGGDDLVIAGGGGGGGSANCANGNLGSAATGAILPSRTTSVTIVSDGGAAGGAGAVDSSGPGGSGGHGSLTISFSSALGASPSSGDPVVNHLFSWRGEGSGAQSTSFPVNTWQFTPSASERKLDGHVLLGWATSAQFPVSMARSARSAFDGNVDGQRMIFIPAGMPTFVSGDASLFAIWDVPVTKTLWGRC